MIALIKIVLVFCLFVIVALLNVVRLLIGALYSQFILVFRNKLTKRTVKRKVDISRTETHYRPTVHGGSGG